MQICAARTNIRAFYFWANKLTNIMRISTIVARGSSKIKMLCIIHILPYINNYLLKGLNATIGHNCQITGRVVFRISKRARVSIGDNFRLSSYCQTNPLNNRRTCLSVSDNAELRIGNNVGMSSPTLYVQKSLIIGDNVNLGGGYYCPGFRLSLVELS